MKSKQAEKLIETADAAANETMSISAVTSKLPLAQSVRFDAHRMHVLLLDGREISVPLEWFPPLRKASISQRKRWRLIGRGVGVHWPDLDEDISIAALLQR